MENKRSGTTSYLLDKASIGMRIRKIRLDHDLSQEKFAESIDICTNFVSEIETAKKGMSTETLCRICDVYQVSADYVLFGIKPALSLEVLEQSLNAIPTDEIPTFIDYLKSLYQIRQLHKN